MSRRRSWVWVIQRVLGPIVVVGSIAVHRHIGVDWADAIYETVRIFMLDANTDLAVDQVVDPWIYGALWFLRALGPVVTGAAFIEVLLHLGVFGVIPFYWSHHLVVCGAGRIGSQFVRSALDRGQRVAVIDHDPDNPNLDALRRAGAKVVIGDASEDATLALTKIQRASVLMTTTPNDVLNLNIATLANEMCTAASHELVSICHVYDLRLKQRLSQALEHKSIHAFNVYQLAAEAVARGLDLKDRVVIVGFGRFGRSLMRFLVQNHGSSLTYTVVDSHLEPDTARERWLREFSSPSESVNIEFLCSDIRSPELWDHQINLDEAKIQSTAVVVCTDDDMGNLACALDLRDKPAVSDIYIRLFKPVPLLDELQCGATAQEARLHEIVVWSKMLEGFHIEGMPAAFSSLGRMRTDGAVGRESSGAQ